MQRLLLCLAAAVLVAGDVQMEFPVDGRLSESDLWEGRGAVRLSGTFDRKNVDGFLRSKFLVPSAGLGEVMLAGFNASFGATSVSMWFSPIPNQCPLRVCDERCSPFDISSQTVLEVVVPPDVDSQRKGGRFPLTVDPSPGTGTIVVLQPSPVTVLALHMLPVVVQVFLCGERFTDAILSHGTDLLNISSTGWDTAHARWEFRGDKAHAVLTLPPQPSFDPSVRTVSFAFTGGAQLFESGIAPSIGRTEVNVTQQCGGHWKPDCSGCAPGYVMQSGTVLPNASRCTECPLCDHGTCIEGPKCLCDEGYTGDLCNRLTQSAVAGAVAGGGVVGSVALQVALGGTLIAPVHTLTALQLVYQVGGLSCSKAQESVEGLRITVFPLRLQTGGNSYANAAAGTLMLHCAGLLLHGIVAVAVRSAGRVLFPNLQLAVLHVITIPLLAAFIPADPPVWGGVVGAWSSCCIVGMVAFLVWLRSEVVKGKKVEYLAFNMGNTVDNATRPINTTSRRGVAPGWLLHALPKGQWCSNHLAADRAFLRKYGAVFGECTPEGAKWFPFVDFLRLVILAALLAPRHGACTVRVAISVASEAVYAGLILVRAPYTSLGSNTVSAVVHLCLALAFLLFLVDGSKARIALVVAAVAIVANALWAVVAFVAIRRRYDPIILQSMEDEDRSADERQPASLSGEVEVNGESVVCELRGGLFVVGTTPVALKDHKVTPTAKGWEIAGHRCVVGGDQTPSRAEWVKGLLSRTTAESNAHRVEASLPSRCPREYDDLPEVERTTMATLQHCVRRGGDGTRLIMHRIDKAKLTASQRRAAVNEIVILSTLKSPFLVQVQGAHETASTIGWVTLYYPGHLVDYIQLMGAFPEPTARFFAAEVLLGLEHLHANNMVFRNLTPHDVLFTSDGHAILAEPGLPYGIGDPAKAGYLAPEVLLHHPATYESDWWSFGCVVYEMLLGAPPFNATTHSTAARMVLSGPTPRMTGVSEAAAELLTSLLVKSPRDRAGCEVKTAPFFTPLKWHALEARALPPPFLPPPPPTPRSLAASPDPPLNPLHFIFTHSSPIDRYAILSTGSASTTGSPNEREKVNAVNDEPVPTSPTPTRRQEQ